MARTVRYETWRKTMRQRFEFRLAPNDPQQIEMRRKGSGDEWIAYAYYNTPEQTRAYLDDLQSD